MNPALHIHNSDYDTNDINECPTPLPIEKLNVFTGGKGAAGDQWILRAGIATNVEGCCGLVLNALFL